MDNKIYINSTNGVQHIHYINFPDSGGLACDVHQHGVVLQTYNAFTMPNYPNYFLGPVAGSVCDSLGVTTKDIVYDKNLNLRINPNPAQNILFKLSIANRHQCRFAYIQYVRQGSDAQKIVLVLWLFADRCKRVK